MGGGRQPRSGRGLDFPLFHGPKSHLATLCQSTMLQTGYFSRGCRRELKKALTIGYFWPIIKAKIRETERGRTRLLNMPQGGKTHGNDKE